MKTSIFRNALALSLAGVSVLCSANSGLERSFSFEELKQVDIKQLESSRLFHEGAGSSGGGTVVTCNLDGVAESRLLEIYEASKNPNIKLTASRGSAFEDYVQAVYRLNRYLGYSKREVQSYIPMDDLAETFYEFYQKAYWTDESLPFLNDVGETISIPEGCKLELVALYMDSEEKILINKAVFAQLDELSKAALVQHEYWYKAYRERFNSINTQHLRNLIILFYSDAGFKPFHVISSESDIKCKSDKGTKVFISNREGQLALNIEEYRGQASFTKSESTFDNLSLYFRELRSTSIGVIHKETSFFYNAISKADSPILPIDKVELIIEPSQPISIKFTEVDNKISFEKLVFCQEIM